MIGSEFLDSSYARQAECHHLPVSMGGAQSTSENRKRAGTPTSAQERGRLVRARAIKLSERLDGSVCLIVDLAVFIRCLPAFIDRDGGVLATTHSPAT
jgi:hypothetical protein